MNYKAFYKKLFRPVERRIGPINDKTIAAIMGFDGGGPVSLCTVGDAGDEFLTYVTCELAVREEQIPGDIGRYEIMMACDDEAWARKILTKMGQMSMNAAFGHGHTVDISPVVGPRFPLKGLIVEEFTRITIDDSPFGIFRVHGVTRLELEFARDRGVDELLKRLKRSEIYPHTRISRRASISPLS